MNNPNEKDHPWFMLAVIIGWIVVLCMAVSHHATHDPDEPVFYERTN